MSIIDIREDIPSLVNEIIFGDEACEGLCMAQNLTRFHQERYVAIGDTSSDRVLLHSKQHALDLIKALEKSIELGWLK